MAQWTFHSIKRRKEWEGIWIISINGKVRNVHGWCVKYASERIELCMLNLSATKKKIRRKKNALEQSSMKLKQISKKMTDNEEDSTKPTNVQILIWSIPPHMSCWTGHRALCDDATLSNILIGKFDSFGGGPSNEKVP